MLMTPIYLYHGTSVPIEGELIMPRKGKDAKNRPENMHTAVYATDSKDIAIAMAILRCKGVKMSSIRFTQNPPATIYDGWPEQEEIYLYTISPSKFQQTSMKKQWISLFPTKPLKVERIRVADFLHLVRRASEDERIKWLQSNLNKI